MSGHTVLDRQKLALAFSEVDLVRKVLPRTALTTLAQEVVKRVAENLVVQVDRKLAPSPEEIDHLCEALLSADHSAAIALIEQAQKDGVSYDDLCIHYLAEASRRLGTWWDEDRVSFYRVTIAAGRIYAILRILRLQRPSQVADLRRSAIFASVPGDSHTLGITMAADMARQHNWDIELFVGLSHDDLVDIMARRDQAFIGLSAGARATLPALIRLIVALRISNPRAQIMICGQIAAIDVNLQGLTGADHCASDFDTALRVMEDFALARRANLN